MTLEKYIPGEEKNSACLALLKMMDGFDPDQAYANMIRLRLSGVYSKECKDIFYTAFENDQPLSRHWNGWGKHKDAVGNWGHFYTDESCRGKGIGKKLLNFWFEDLKSWDDTPLCFLCSAGTKELTDLYRRYGFRPAIEGTDHGYLYMPLQNSPESFRELHQNYYQPSKLLFHRPATVEYRHEIDCLLRYTFSDLGLGFSVGRLWSIEEALLKYPDQAGMYFSEDGHCVGCSFEGKVKIHPIYKDSEIVEEFN